MTAPDKTEYARTLYQRLSEGVIVPLRRIEVEHEDGMWLPDPRYCHRNASILALSYLSGDDVSNIALFDHLYPEFNLDWREDKLKEFFDWVPVDVESVRAYVYWLEIDSTLIQGTKKDLALRQALTILGIASVTKGYYLQRKKTSPFGRTYYEGTSVQNVNKELRRAMLGNCWEYDIRSSVVAWKMGYARSYLLANGLDHDLKKSFPATLLYLEDKVDFMATVRHFVFPDSSPVPKELRPKLLKQAFTAISFGARQTAKGWLDASGNWTNSALVEILQNSEDRTRFLADATVKLFIKEHNALDEYLFDLFKKHRPDLLLERYLQTDSGRPSKAKVSVEYCWCSVDMRTYFTALNNDF